MKNIMLKVIIIITLIFTSGEAFAQENVIHQVKNKTINIDGNLKDWADRAWYPVAGTWSGSEVSPSPDLEVKVSLAFDTNNFYLAVIAYDDKFETVNRSWRYGDGFFFTVVTDLDKEVSSYVYQYGFSQKEKFLVFRNGEYFPRFSSRNVKKEFKKYKDRVEYEIAIPYSLLKPFNPFNYKKAAFNLIYTDRDNSNRTTVMLNTDRNYDTEQTNQRAGKFFRFAHLNPTDSKNNSFHCTLKKNFFRTEKNISIKYTILSNESRQNCKMESYIIHYNNRIQEDSKYIGIPGGLSRGIIQYKIKNIPSGNYMLNVQFKKDNNIKIAEYSEDIYIINPDELADYRKKITVFKKNINLAASLSNLEIRFKWLDEFFTRPNYEDISPLNIWLGDIIHLLEKLESSKPALFEPATGKRYAHRSKIDNTLQPYSMTLPKDFDPQKKYPLIVALHGSGVDEKGYFRGAGRMFSKLKCPIIAPKARGLSDWYAGNSGEDVFECIEHFIKLYPNIDRANIFLTGFSMGGYGTWRLGLLKPGYFKGLAILSGALVPPERTGGENILNMIDKIKTGNFLIIHGDRDNAVPIENTREAVKKLKAINTNVTYIEIPGAAHGNYNKWQEVVNWIQELIKK